MHKMVRPVFYKVLARFFIGLVFALLWDRFINVQKLYSMITHTFFIIGILFFAIAWVSYLRIDGLRLPFVNSGKNKNKKNHPQKYPIDYADEKPSPNDSLDGDEEKKANLIANIAAGLCFLLPSLIGIIFR